MLRKRLAPLLTALLLLGGGHSALAQVLVGGGFEGGFSGWTLSSGDGNLGMWVSVDSGASFDSNDIGVLDAADGVTGPAICISDLDEQPLLATQGDQLALSLTNGQGIQRIYQDVTLPADAHLLSWDMSYDNQSGLFLDDSQEFTLNIRDTQTDAIIQEIYATTEGEDPAELFAMTGYAVDVSAFAGQTVRVDVTHFTDDDCFPLALDNFSISQSCGDGAVQGTDECDDGPGGSPTCTATCTLVEINEDPSESLATGGEEDASGCQTGTPQGTWFLFLGLLLGYRRKAAHVTPTQRR